MWRKSALAILSLVVSGVVVSATPNTALAAAPAFRAAASANSNTTSATVNVPAAVQEGDQLVLVVTANTNTTATTPTGWTLSDTRQDGGPDMTSWVFTRTAPSGLGGSLVNVPLGRTSKVARTLVAYSGAAEPTVVSSSVIGRRRRTSPPRWRRCRSATASS